MNPILRNILAVIIGAAVCIFLNGLLLGLMMKLTPPPEGFDPNNFKTYSLLQNKHFVTPFVAHAVPSLIGGLIAALVVGGLHMIGGIMAAFMIPAPAWFVALDLIVAYLPMAWIGGKLARA